MDEHEEITMYETVFDRFDEWVGKAKWFFVGVGALAAAIALALWVSPL
jgi:threonine aldolase